jgi:hypothetical protein
MADEGFLINCNASMQTLRIRAFDPKLTYKFCEKIQLLPSDQRCLLMNNNQIVKHPYGILRSPPNKPLYFVDIATIGEAVFS